jgi:hypothetical protein
VNLFLAAMWFMISLGILMMPDPGPDAAFGLSPEKRPWAAGLAMVLSGYNVIRWRLVRERRRSAEESHVLRETVRRRHHEEPPNPDFDFGDPTPGRDDPERPRVP